MHLHISQDTLPMRTASYGSLTRLVSSPPSFEDRGGIFTVSAPSRPLFSSMTLTSALRVWMIGQTPAPIAPNLTPEHFTFAFNRLD